MAVELASPGDLPTPGAFTDMVSLLAAAIAVVGEGAIPEGFAGEFEDMFLRPDLLTPDGLIDPARFPPDFVAQVMDLNRPPEEPQPL
jgi:hypothetical protein